MPWVEFNPRLPLFDQAKTIHALDPRPALIGPLGFLPDTIFAL
jgi:hypothetical protein